MKFITVISPIRKTRVEILESQLNDFKARGFTEPEVEEAKKKVTKKAKTK